MLQRKLNRLQDAGATVNVLRWYERLPKERSWKLKDALKLLSSQVKKGAKSHQVRLLRESDIRIGSGYFETLASLRKEEGKISIPRAIKQFYVRCGMGMKTFVVIVEGQIVATTTIIFEPKHIHNSGWIGHVEDVATREGFGGNGFSTELLRRVTLLAIAKGCYKVILDCSVRNITFYGRLGFYVVEHCMRKDLV